MKKWPWQLACSSKAAWCLTLSSFARCAYCILFLQKGKFILIILIMIIILLIVVLVLEWNYLSNHSCHCMETCGSTEHNFRTLPSDVQMLLVKWHRTTNSWQCSLACKWKEPTWQAFFTIKSGMQNLQNINCIYFCCMYHAVWLCHSKAQVRRLQFQSCDSSVCVRASDCERQQVLVRTWSMM